MSYYCLLHSVEVCLINVLFLIDRFLPKGERAEKKQRKESESSNEYRYAIKKNLPNKPYSYFSNRVQLC